jgi:SAM-dependent methyltransferase
LKTTMSQTPEALCWAAARGDKWGAHLSGMEATLAPIDEPLFQALELDAPVRIAEVGCGGGGTAAELLRRAPAGSVVHGFDISPGLIELARARTRPDEGAIAFEVADMASATPARPYERLVSRFGVMFFDDPPVAFGNLVRWLEPGGRFAFAVWGPPSENLGMATVREVVARIIELPRVDPDAPGPFRYADAERLLALLERAGFAELHVREWRGALPIGGELPPEEAARFALSSFSNFSELLTEAGEEALSEAHRSLTASFAENHHDGAVRMDACVRIFTGVRP